MKLRDNVGLLVEAAELIQYARGPFGKMYTAEDVAGRILDAVDRALTGPIPSPPTCKQSLQVGPGTATTEGKRDMSDQELLARVMRILEDVKYGQRRIIPAACDIVELFASPSPGTGGGATVFVPPAPSECPGCAKVQRHPGEGYVCAWHMPAPAAPAAEPGKPETCEKCGGSGYHDSGGSTFDYGACPCTGRATPEKGGR